MHQNEGSTDRVARVALGSILLTLVFLGPQTWLGLLGVIPLFTGLVGYCPMYRVLGLSTRATKT